jgi:hypothetical protein
MTDSDDEGPRVFRAPQSREESLREAQLDLYELIKKGQAIQSREARERAARLTSDQLAAVQARHLRLSQLAAERFEWRPVAAVVMFEVQTCSHCCRQHKVFRGFGTRFMRRSDSTMRIAQAECLDRGLPLETHEILSQAPLCVECMAEVASDGPMRPYELHLNRRETDAPS